MAFKCSSERKCSRFLTLNQKLEMIKLMEEGMLKGELGFLQPNSQVLNAKEKLLKEIKSCYSSEHMNDKKANSLIADMERIEDQTSHYVPLSQEAAVSYPENLTRTINESGYTKQQILNVDKTAFYGKMMPSRTFKAQEKSMLGFKASRLTLIEHLKNARVLKNYAKSTRLCSTNETTKPMTVHPFTAWFTEYFNPVMETHCSKKIPFKILLTDNASGYRALTEMYKETNVVFRSINTLSILEQMVQGAILTFQSSLCESRLHHCTAATVTKQDLVSTTTTKNTFLKKFTSLEVIKNTCDSWEEAKLWKKLIPTLMNDFEGFKTSVDEVAADGAELARELELQMESEDVTELLMIKRDSLTSASQSVGITALHWFRYMESTHGDDMSIVEMTTKNLDCTNLVDKTAAGFERTDSNF
uniref:Uncharacterized protein n=1 Tax=Chlorocebus sabaeus TaxID=60711 RepID=A0A0D9R3B8_CHLSB